MKMPPRFVSLTLSLMMLCGSAVAQNAIQSQMGFGYSIKVIGSTIAVGEPLNGAIPGMVYLFDRDETSGWAVSFRLSADDGMIGNNFGISLAGSGNRLFVGAGGSDKIEGAVYIFGRSNGYAWLQEAVVRPDSLRLGDGFASAIEYFDGRLFVSHQPTNGSPVVYVYEQRDDRWVMTSTVSPQGEGDHSRFGASLAADGQTLLVGSPRDGSGIVHIYTAGEAGDWVAAGTVTGIDQPRGAGDGVTRSQRESFGTSLLLTGRQLFVTAPDADRYTGRVYSFYRSDDGQFDRGPNFTPFDARIGHSFARDVALVGNDLWISALSLNRLAGGIYVMRLSDDGHDVIRSTKLYEQKVLPMTFFGEAMDSGEDFVAVGANQDVFRSGAVYVYQRDPGDGSWLTSQKLMAPRDREYASVRGGRTKCVDGEADGFGCDRVDMVSFVNNHDLGLEPGILTSDVWGWTDSESGKEYALVGSNTGTSFVDISDPLEPKTLGVLPRTSGSPPSIWRDIKVYKDHAFIVSDGAGAHGVQIFDLHLLRSASDSLVVFQETAHYDGIASAHNIVINEETGFAYTVGNSAGGETCGGGSHIIDVRDPVHPKFAGCFAHTGTGRVRTGYTHDAQCVTYKGADERFQGREICFAANETAISIADVTDKSETKAIARGDYPNPGYTHQGWLSEDHRYFFVNDELDELNGGTDGTRTLIWDVAELDDPILVNEYVSTNKASDHNLYIRGNYMYQSNYVSGLRVVDVSNVEAPVEVGHFDTVPWGPDKPGFGGSWSNYPFFKSGVIIVTSGEEGLFVLKRSQVDS